MTETSEEEDLPKSRSQQKREVAALTSLGSRLLDIPDSYLARLSDQTLIAAVRDARNIPRGGAKKRQVRYIGKLMRDTNVQDVRGLLDELDSSSKRHAQLFHRLERWRNELMDEVPHIHEEILAECPSMDRQRLRRLTRAAIVERDRDDDNLRHFRRLFRFLRDEI